MNRIGILFLFGIFNTAFATEISISPPHFNAIKLDVIQSTFELNNQSIARAEIVFDNGIYKGLHVLLKPQSAKQFNIMSKENIGKTIQITLSNQILNTAIIHSELTEDILITGITQEVAQLFLKELQAQDALLKNMKNNHEL